MEEPGTGAPRLDSQHYRELAIKLRDIARQCRFPGARQEILDLASRYEVRANHLDARGLPDDFAQAFRPFAGFLTLLDDEEHCFQAGAFC